MTGWLRVASVLGIGMLFALSVFTVFAQPPGTQILGTIASVTDDEIAHEDGSSFPLAEQMRVSQIWPAAAADLMPGQYLSIAARRELDGTLHASLVAVFPEGTRPNEGQRELVEFRFCEPICQPRDLMTNAAIQDARLDAVNSGLLTISYAGETNQLRISPETRVEMQHPGTMDDVVPGATALVFVNPEGVANLVWVYMD